MIKLTYLPLFIRIIFKGIPGVWKRRHLLLLCWAIFLQTIVPGKKTVKELSRWSPSHITEWRLRRLFKAAYWTLETVLTWFAEEAISCFPPPKDRTIYFEGDGSHTEKTGRTNELVQKSRKGNNKPWFFGIKFILCAVCWENYRIPVAFKLILPKSHSEYKKENELFREMLASFTPPYWARRIIVLGDCAYASSENMKTVNKRNEEDGVREWFFVFAIAKTWKTADGRHVKDIAARLDQKGYRRTWISSLYNPKKRKTYWLQGKKLSLRHLGEVTVIFSKKRRNMGLKNTRLFVTNLPDVTPRQVISIYQKRWAIEIIFKELKSGLGLGDAQIIKEADRTEKAMGIAVLSYLFLLIARKKDIEPGKSWSIFQLQNNFRIDVISNQIRHSMGLKIKNFGSLVIRVAISS